MLRFKTLPVVLVCSAVAAVGCERAKSANPLSPDLAGPIPGVAISAPTPLDPPQGGQVLRGSTPPTFTAENASSSGQRTLYLQLQLAADENFQKLVHHADRIEPGGNGRTTYRLPEQLGAGYRYYWRLRAADGANVGPYSFTSTFTVVDPVIIEPPTPIEPAGAITTNRPVFRVRNGKIEGTSEAYYRFQLATAPDPSAIIAVVTVPPGANGETTVSIGDLPYGRTFYWRVYGSDGTTESPFSPLISFTTPNAPSPAPTPGNPTPTIPGTGARTPNPPPGQRLPEPSDYHIVQAVANQYPSFLLNSCQEHGGTWQFMDTLVDTLRQTDTRYGYIWKRGVVGDPLKDVVGYNWSSDPDEGTRNVYTFDVIGGHCGSNPSPTWSNTQPGGGPGQSVWTGRGRF
jgi:hypothetical protein